MSQRKSNKFFEIISEFTFVVTFITRITYKYFSIIGEIFNWLTCKFSKGIYDRMIVKRGTKESHFRSHDLKWAILLVS